MSLFERWVGGWQCVKDRAGAAYTDMVLEPLVEEWKLPLAPRVKIAANLALRLELFAERMEALAHVLQQRTPVDNNSHAHSLEEVGRIVYTVKAAVALVLGNYGDVGGDLNSDPVCVAVFDKSPGYESDHDASWTEVIVPPGLSSWRVEVRRDTSY